MGTRQREYNHICMCDQCGATFFASRYDARFCTPKCRAKYRRVELKRSQELDRIKRAIDELMMSSRYEVADLLARDIANYAMVYAVKVIGSTT